MATAKDHGDCAGGDCAGGEWGVYATNVLMALMRGTFAERTRMRCHPHPPNDLVKPVRRMHLWVDYTGCGARSLRRVHMQCLWWVVHTAKALRWVCVAIPIEKGWCFDEPGRIPSHRIDNMDVQIRADVMRSTHTESPIGRELCIIVISRTPDIISMS